MKYYIVVIFIIIFFVVLMLNENEHFVTINSIVPTYNKESYYFYDINTFKFLVFNNNELNKLGQFFQDTNPTEFNIQTDNQYFPIKYSNDDVYIYFDNINKLFYSKKINYIPYHDSFALFYQNVEHVLYFTNYETGIIYFVNVNNEGSISFTLNYDNASTIYYLQK